MAFKFADSVRETSTTTGTGTLNLAGAVSGYQTFVAGIGTTNTCPYTIEDANGTGWEHGIGTVTDATPDTLARTTILSSSNSNNAISLSAGTHTVYCSWVARQAQNAYEVDQTYIRGLLVTKTSAQNKIDVSAGACYDPSSGKVITYAGATAVAVGTLGASQWNQVYIYDSSGTATIEVTNNADPPSTAYAGTARQGGTNSNRRWIGSFLTDSSNNIYDGQVLEFSGGALRVLYYANIGASPFRVLSAGTSSTLASVSLVGAIPRYVAVEMFCYVWLNYATTAANTVQIDFSLDNSNSIAAFGSFANTTAEYPQVEMILPILPSTPNIYYKVSGSGTGERAYIDVGGYRAAR